MKTDGPYHHTKTKAILKGENDVIILLLREELFVILIPGEISSITVSNSGPRIMVWKAKRPIQVSCLMVMLVSLKNLSQHTICFTCSFKVFVLTIA